MSGRAERIATDILRWHEGKTECDEEGWAAWGLGRMRPAWQDTEGKFKAWIDEFDPEHNDADAMMALIEWRAVDVKHRIVILSLLQTKIQLRLQWAGIDRWHRVEGISDGNNLRNAVCTALDRWGEER